MSIDTIPNTPEAEFNRITMGKDAPIIEWVQPTQFDASSWADVREIGRRFDDGRLEQKVDRIDDIADGLFDLYHPNKKDDSEARHDFVENMLAEGPAAGTWFGFDWDKKLVRYPSEDAYFDARTNRNHNVDTVEDSRKMRDATLVIAGASVGSHIARRLVQGGMGDRLILGDMDTTSLSNLNRLEDDIESLGTYKIDNLAKWVSKKDPYILLHLMREGMSIESLQRLSDELDPDVYYDAVDNMQIKAAIRDVAVGKSAVMMATDLDHKTILDVERHDLEPTEPFNGRLGEEIFRRLLEGKLSDKELDSLTARIIGLSNVSARMLDSVMAIDDTLGGFPQLDATAANGGALAAHATRAILLDRGLKSGRYISSPEKILHTKSPTSRREAAVVFGRFLQRKLAKK